MLRYKHHRGDNNPCTLMRMMAHAHAGRVHRCAMESFYSPEHDTTGWVSPSLQRSSCTPGSMACRIPMPAGVSCVPRTSTHLRSLTWPPRPVAMRPLATSPMRSPERVTDSNFRMGGWGPTEGDGNDTRDKADRASKTASTVTPGALSGMRAAPSRETASMP